MANQDFFVVSAVYSAHLPLWLAALAILVEKSRAWIFTSVFKYIYFKGTAFEEGLQLLTVLFAYVAQSVSFVVLYSCSGLVKP